MKSVKFLYAHSPYIPGDIAGFEDFVANSLVKAGFAEFYKPETPRRKLLKDNLKDRQMKSDDPGVVTK